MNCFFPLCLISISCSESQNTYFCYIYFINSLSKLLLRLGLTSPCVLLLVVQQQEATGCLKKDPPTPRLGLLVCSPPSSVVLYLNEFPNQRPRRIMCQKPVQGRINLKPLLAD